MSAAPSHLTLEDERRLLKQLHRGDHAAFRVLYEAFSARLYRRVILPRVGLEDVAEDILRETFLVAFEKIHKVSWQGRSLYHWLSRVASNKVVDFHRANRRTQAFVEGFTPLVEIERPAPVTPEAQLLAEEQVERARMMAQSLLERLNPRYRRAVELRFFEQHPREVCAEALGVTVGNFDVILFRALKRLRKLYGSVADEQQGPTR